MKVNCFRVLYILISLSLGVLAGLFGDSFIHNNTQAVNIIVTVFSILSGFLIAIITMIGDSSYLVNARSWRTLEVNRDKFITRLFRHKLLFLLYLTTLILIFVASLIKAEYPDAYASLEQIFLGFATTSFVLSFSLPFSLVNTQIKKHDLILEATKKHGTDHLA